MNILHIISRFDSYDAVTQVLDLSRCLVKNNCNCIIASSLNTNILEIDKLNIENYYLPSFETNIKNSFIAYNKLKEIVKTNNIDIIHTHSPLSNLLGFLISRYTDITLVSSCYDFYSKNILNYSFILAKKVIIHSEVLAKYLVDNFNFSREHIQFIKPSLDLDRFNFYGVDQHSKTDFNIGVVSWQFPNKGYEYFLKAMVKVVRNIPNTKILILTFRDKLKHSIKEDLQLWIRRLGLSYYVKFEDIKSLPPKILSTLNLLITTPLIENAYTRMILEAQANGVPVIATRVGGVTEIITDQNLGILVSQKDNNDLAQATIKILKSFQLSRELTNLARQRIEEEFNLNKNIGDFIDTYQKTKNSTKILMINIGKTQDVILSIPSLRLLRKKFKDAKIVSLINHSLRGLLQRSPYIDELILYDNAHKRFLGFLNIAKLLIENRFDIVFDFNNSFKTHLLSYLTLANKRYGYRDRFFKFLINYGIENPNKSEGPVKNRLDILNLLDVDTSDDRLELWPSKDDMEFADKFLKDGWVSNTKVVGMDISFRKRFFDNPKIKDYMAYLCEKLTAHHVKIVLINSANGTNKKDKKFKEIKSKLISKIEDISTMQLACLIKKCDIYITSNPGSIYLAIAMQTPSIILSSVKEAAKLATNKNIEILTDKDFALDIKSISSKKRTTKIEYRDLIMDKINRLIQKR